MDNCKVINVIESTITRRGTGVKGSPVRMVTEYWSTDGEKLAEVDPCEDSIELNKVEIQALKQVQALLTGFCDSETYTCTDGKASINLLFTKLRELNNGKII